MKKAIQFGAGNIGRGFIGELLQQAGYDVVFADVNQTIIDKINQDKHYTVFVKDTECRDEPIDGVSGVNSTNVQILDEICEAELITTAVGLVILPRIAPVIAKGILLRKAQGIIEPLNIIACENGLKASSQLKEEVYKALSKENQSWCDQFVGFPDCAVDRIVPPVKTENFIDVVVEKFYEWDVDKGAVVGHCPDVKGMVLADNLIAYIERKLFTLNTGHAITAYLGTMKGYTTINESIADEQILSIVKGAMQQSGLSLVQKYGFNKETHFKYIDTIIGRFKNPFLKDEVSRVGREPLRKLSANDRLIKPLLTANEYGLDVDKLLLGIGAALHYHNPQDKQSVEMQQKIAQKGLRDAVVEITSLDKDHPMVEQILHAYQEVEHII